MKWLSRYSLRRSIWRWSCAALLTIISVVLFAWVAAEALIVRVELNHADALAVLAGSSTYQERAIYAAQLFKEGRASRILLTNDGLQSGYSAKDDRNPLFVERALEELTHRGVPAGSIIILPEKVSSTYDEALRLRRFSDKQNLKSILIVTSGYQSRRALWTMRRVFQTSNTQIGLAPVEPGSQSPASATWWRHRLGWQMVPGEYLKLAYYRLKY